MATKKITDLVEITTAASDDVLPIVDVSLDITNKITTTNLLKSKQDLLESGTNIKTINSTSLLGSGDVAVQETLVSGTNIKTINSTSLLGSGDISISANPSGGAGLIQFSDGSAFASDSNLFWDNTNKRFGIGTNVPSKQLQVYGANPEISTKVSSNGTAKCSFLSNLNAELGSLSLNFASGEMRLFNSISYFPTFYSSGIEAMRINTSQNLGIGTGSTISARTHIKGSGSTSATTSLLVQNSVNTDLFRLQDDGRITTKLDLFNFQSTSSVTKATFDTFSGRFTFGDGTLNSSAVVSMNDTTRGFLPPRMTTTQKNAISSPAAGLQVYDTTLNQMSYYNGSSWINF